MSGAVAADDWTSLSRDFLDGGELILPDDDVAHT